MIKLDVTGHITWTGGQTWDTARILADHTGKAAVWAGGRHGSGYTLAWSGHITSTAPAAAGGAVVLTAGDGTTLTAVKDSGGCGCGSRLSVLGEMDLALASVPA